MNARLAYNDYKSPTWESIELTSDLSSHRSFWTAVLQFATADGADAVLFRLDSEEDCLAIEVGSQVFPMEPPPAEYRQELLATAHRLATKGLIRFMWNRLAAITHRSRYVGRILVETPDGFKPWFVYRLTDGLRIQRKISPAAPPSREP